MITNIYVAEIEDFQQDILFIKADKWEKECKFKIYKRIFQIKFRNRNRFSNFVKRNNENRYKSRALFSFK